MRFAILASFVFLAVGCSKSGDSGSGASVNAESIAPTGIVDKIYYYGVQKTNGDKLIAYAQLDSANSAKSVTILFKSNGNAIYRKSVGTYTRNGTTYNFTYSYETCNPVHSEQIDIAPSSNGLATVKLSGSPTSYIYRDSSIYYVAGLDLSNLGSMTEDVNCSLIVSNDLQKMKNREFAEMKIETSSRKPASVK